MKKLVLLFFILSFTAISCRDEGEPELSQQIFMSDNEELEEAKAITRKLFEGLEKVEENKMSREDFKKMAEPLQRELNMLIISMEAQDAQKLESYKDELMVKNIQKEKDPSNT